MARTLKSTLNFLMRDPIMDNRPSADYGKCSKEPYRIPSSVFMLFPFFCDCLHSILSSACYYTINLRRCVRAGILSGFPGSSFRRLSSARLLRGSGLSANGYSPSAENGEIVPHPAIRRNRRRIFRIDEGLPLSRPRRRAAYGPAAHERLHIIL